MRLFISIDDTDNRDSPGSGQLADTLSNDLLKWNLIDDHSSISRHQLFYSSAIPYTSHNSAMCFTATVHDTKVEDLLSFSQKFLKKNSAPGSDPGLCVARENETLNVDELIAYGIKAKSSILSKDEAYTLAAKTNIHLSEHGGSGEGVIGALAGVGLRMQGSDGRLRGWLNMGSPGQLTTCNHLTCHHDIDCVIDNNGNILPHNSKIILSESSIKPILHDHRNVIPVIPCDTVADGLWKTLTKSETKSY